MNNQNIAVELIYSYLNSPSYYTKSYITDNFQIVIQLLAKELDNYLEVDSNIKQETLGSESVTYNTRNLSDVIDKFKVFLPTPKRKGGVLYC